jgi:hypothetical protein
MTSADNSEALVLVDGRSGAGKTDYATALAKESGATLVSLDDVYPGWDGLDAGSWHIAHSLIIPISLGQPGRYRRWNWEQGIPGEWVAVPEGRPLVVEGCGVLRHDTAGVQALRLWIDAPDAIRHDRALARDGDMYTPHWTRWALQEDRFIALHGGEMLAARTVRTG